MTGSVLARQLKGLVDNIETYGMISGTPGQYALSIMHSVAAAAPEPAFAGLAPMSASAPVTPLTPGQAGMADTAVKKSNAAALATPAAGSGNATNANTAVSVITSVLSGLPVIAATPQNIHDFEAGTSATLHWWGWSLNLDQTATIACKWLLDNDLEGFTAAAAGVLAVSAPLAGALAILTVAAKGLSAWITAANTNAHGVTINGYMWIGIDVTGNP